MRQKHKGEHDRLRALINDYLDMLRANTAPDVCEIMRRRLAFSNAFLGHVASEGPVFNRLRTGNPDHPSDRLLNEYGCRLRDMMPGYSALIQEWTPQRIVAEWAAYGHQVHAQVHRYYVFLAWEEAEILPLLDREHSAARRAG